MIKGIDWRTSINDLIEVSRGNYLVGFCGPAVGSAADNVAAQGRQSSRDTLLRFYSSPQWLVARVTRTGRWMREWRMYDAQYYLLGGCGKEWMIAELSCSISPKRYFGWLFMSFADDVIQNHLCRVKGTLLSKIGLNIIDLNVFSEFLKSDIGDWRAFCLLTGRMDELRPGLFHCASWFNTERPQKIHYICFTHRIINNMEGYNILVMDSGL
jgi:hypothetical protein